MTKNMFNAQCSLVIGCDVNAYTVAAWNLPTDSEFQVLFVLLIAEISTRHSVCQFHKTLVIKNSHETKPRYSLSLQKLGGVVVQQVVSIWLLAIHFTHLL